MTDPIDISPDQRKTLLRLFNDHLPTIEVWAFGSRVQWKARSNSDLDLVVFAKQEEDYRVSQLKEALEESSLPFSVDLLVWDNLPEHFQNTIRERHVVFIQAHAFGENNLSAFESLGPPQAIQHKIAKILDNLDHKIDLNHRIDQTLEAMAQALYKSGRTELIPTLASSQFAYQKQNQILTALRNIIQPPVHPTAPSRVQ